MVSQIQMTIVETLSTNVSFNPVSHIQGVDFQVLIVIDHKCLQQRLTACVASPDSTYFFKLMHLLPFCFPLQLMILSRISCQDPLRPCLYQLRMEGCWELAKIPLQLYEVSRRLSIMIRWIIKDTR